MADTVTETFKVLQLNVEGISPPKREVISKIALDLSIDVIALQETHTTQDKQLLIKGYTCITYQHHKQYGIATYAKVGLTASELCSSPVNSQLQWSAISICDQTILNVYKPPNVTWPSPLLPSLPKPVLYCGDFNSPHSAWGYTNDSPQGTQLMEWATTEDIHCLFCPKQPKSFLSSRWQTGTNPDLAFYDNLPDSTNDAHRTVLDRFPRSQHRPSVIIIGSVLRATNSSPTPRWNFEKANWKLFAELLDRRIVLADTIPKRGINDAYDKLCDAINHAALGSIPRGARKDYIPGWSKTCNELYNKFVISGDKDSRASAATELCDQLDKERREIWNKSVTSIDFTHSSRKAWRKLQQLTSDPSLKKREYPVSANAVAAQLLNNGRFPGDRTQNREVRTRTHELRNCASVDNSLDAPFSLEEMNSALNFCYPRKAPGPDKMHNEFLTHMSPKCKSLLLDILNACLRHCHVPSLWRKANIVAIPKPGKTLSDPKSYRPISLLCSTYKLLERMVLARIQPTVESFLPKEQAGFRPNRCTTDQVARLTEDIEVAYDDKLIFGAVFVDLTAAYDTIWHRGLELKLLINIPNKHLVNMMMEMIRNRSFTLTLGTSKSRPRRIKNGLPQGSVLAPVLFNIYTADLPETRSKKYSYADDMCLGITGSTHDEVSHDLTLDLDIIHEYLNKWHLILSEKKTVVCAFHLNNKLAGKELHVKIKDRVLIHDAHPAYLGVTLDRSLTYREHISKLGKKVNSRVNLIRKLAGTNWGASASTLRTSTLALVHSAAEYCAPVWEASTHTHRIDTVLNSAMRTISGTLKSTPTECLPVLTGIAPHNIRRQISTAKLSWRAQADPESILFDVVHGPPPSRLKSRTPLSSRLSQYVSMAPSCASGKKLVSDALTMEKWNTDWRSSTSKLKPYFAPNLHLPPGAHLPRKSWCRRNRLVTGHGRTADKLHKWGMTDSPACDCGADSQTALHIVSDCPNRKLLGGMQGLASCAEGASEWLAGLDIDV